MSAAEKLAEERRYTRTIRCEIIKPLDRTWDDVGSVLRRQRAVVHRLLNAGVIAAFDWTERTRRGEPIASSPELKAGALGVPPLATYVNHGVQRALTEFNEWAEKKAPAAVVRFGSGVLSDIASASTTAFGRWRSGKGNERIPSFKKGHPIPIRKQECKLVKGQRGFELHATIDPPQPRMRLALAHSSGRHAAILRSCVTPGTGYEALASKLDYNERLKKWFVLLSYSAPVQPPANMDPERVLVVHRGGDNFVWLLSSAGGSKNIKGRKLMAQKRVLAARRRDLKTTGACELGAGAKGHGVERRYEFAESLRKKEQRVTHTFCQQVAARVKELAITWGCGRVVIGDYGGIEPDEDRAVRKCVPRLPLYELKQCIVNALQPIGITPDEVSETYVSQLCPTCGNADARQHVKRTGMFRCVACAFERPADWVSALHMLRRARPLQNEHDKRLAEHYELERRLRASKSGSDREESAGSTAASARSIDAREPELAPDLLGEAQEVPCPPGLSQSSTHERERSGESPGGIDKKSRKRGRKGREKGTARKAEPKAAEL